MSVRINTNIEALNAQRNLSATAATFAKSVEKLSSGLRINRAADDSAGLAISEKLKAQVTGLNQAQRNAQDGVSMVQTAEGALNEVHSMLQRIRELSVEAANSTLSSSDSQSVATEITSLRAEIDRIAGATTFNGQNLLTGALSRQPVRRHHRGRDPLNTTGGAATVSTIDVSGAKASTTYTLQQPGRQQDHPVRRQRQRPDRRARRYRRQRHRDHQLQQPGRQAHIRQRRGKTAADLITDLGIKTIVTGAGAAANFQVGANAADSMTVSLRQRSAQLRSGTSATGYGNLDAASRPSPLPPRPPADPASWLRPRP